MHLNILQLMLSGALGAAAGAVLRAGYYAYQRASAERNLLRLIGSSEMLVKVREVVRAKHADGLISDEQLAMAIGELERLAAKLRRNERHMVLAALHQPSQRGRVRYVDKLLQAA